MKNGCRANRLRMACKSAIVVSLMSVPTFAQEATSQPVEIPTTKPADREDSPEPMALNYYVESRAYGAQPETEPPKYVYAPLSNSGIEALKDLTWLDFGVDHRTRFEYRDDDLKRNVLKRDTPFLMRSRAYLGIHDIFDPFRIVAEFQDARRFNSRFPDDDRDADENDLIQLYGELYLKDALGPERPFRLQAGRLAFEYLDRRLISRNPWRNTTNNFDGFRAIFGQLKNDWQLDVLAVQPVERRLRQPDRTNEEEWFYGAIGSWRRWSKIVTLQPYYLVRDQDRKDRTQRDREIHTLGLRSYGVVGKTGFDYDGDFAWQFGDDGERKQRAFAFSSELGYTFQHTWKPRLSGFIGYASGDRHPNDFTTQRFDRLYGFGRPWSPEDYIIWENVIAPKVRFEFTPFEKLRMDTGYGTYWLASDSDSWSAVNRRDPLGKSGDFMGQEFDVRARYQLDPRVEITVGYSHFFVGPFLENTGPADDSDFFYVETSIKF